jgi:tubby and related proteins
MPPWRRASAADAPSSEEPARPLAGGNARVSPELSAERDVEGQEGEEWRWSALVPELLADILRRVDAGAERWPGRRDFVVCACVCRRWREAALALVRPPRLCGGITFLASLKQVRATAPNPDGMPTSLLLLRLQRQAVSQHLFRLFKESNPKRPVEHAILVPHLFL